MRKYIILLLILIFINCKEKESTMEIKFESIKLENGTVVQSADLSEKQYNFVFLQNESNIKRIYNSITHNDPSIIIHETLDGNIIVSSDGYYSLYKNMKDLELVIDDYDPNGVEILDKINIYKEAFPSKTEILIKDLYKKFNVKKEGDYENEIMILSDQILKFNDNEINNKIILNYIALIGENIIQKYNGKWEMELSNDNKTWNPYIIINQNKIDIFSYIIEDIKSQKFSLKSSYDSMNEIILSRD